MGSGGLVKNLVPIEGDPTTLRNVNYAATDVLADQMQRNGVNAGTPTGVKAFKPISLTGATPAAAGSFTTMAQQHVTNRLMQHGFRLGGTIPPKAQPTKSKLGPVILGGDYILTGRDILFHLEVFEDKTGKLVATHDYTVAMTPEVQAILAGQAPPNQPVLAVAQKWPDMQATPVYTTPLSPEVPAASVTGGVMLPPRKPGF